MPRQKLSYQKKRTFHGNRHTGPLGCQSKADGRKKLVQEAAGFAPSKNESQTLPPASTAPWSHPLPHAGFFNLKSHAHHSELQIIGLNRSQSAILGYTRPLDLGQSKFGKDRQASGGEARSD